MANERLIDANAIPWEEHYVPDPDSDKQWDYKKELCVLKPVIDAMPAVDAVEVVHAYWTGGRFNPLTDDYEEYCSHCCAWSTEYDKPYCPNCGAKMDGERKDNENS